MQTTKMLLLLGTMISFVRVGPLTAQSPPRMKPTALVMGDIKLTETRAAEPEQKVIVQAFKLGVEKWCVAHNAFEVRRESPPGGVPAGAIVLNGTITQVEKGSAAARFWVGMGAGQERVSGEFAIHAADGARLTGFVARKSYLGGQGIGGWDMMKLEDVADRLGQLVAETTDKWVR